MVLIAGLAAAAARTASKGGDRRAATQRPQQPGPPDEARAIVPFDFGKVEFRPLLRILPPPGNPLIIDQDQFVTAFLGGCVSRAIADISMSLVRIAFGIFDKETRNGDFLAILEH